MTFLAESIDMVASLQEEVWARVLHIRTGAANAEDVVEYLHYLYAMVEKQQILLTRLELMNDSQYAGLITGIEMIAEAYDRKPHESLQQWHTNMKVEALTALEKETGEPHDPSNIELDIWWNE